MLLLDFSVSTHNKSQLKVLYAVRWEKKPNSKTIHFEQPLDNSGEEELPLIRKTKTSERTRFCEG